LIDYVLPFAHFTYTHTHISSGSNLK